MQLAMDSFLKSCRTETVASAPAKIKNRLPGSKEYPPLNSNGTVVEPSLRNAAFRQPCVTFFSTHLRDPSIVISSFGTIDVISMYSEAPEVIAERGFFRGISCEPAAKLIG